MTQAKQPEALRLAAICETKGMFPVADELNRMHARILELEQGKCLHQIAEPAATPFMHGIADGCGNAYFEEGCVAPEAKDLQPEVDGLNSCLDEDEAPYRLVALYAHPTQPSAQGMDAREFPPMTPELASILGLMCFQCISFAQALRAAGHTIKTHAEDEQAAVLHWMLGHYFRHGDDWRTAAAADMERMKEEAQAAQAKQGGAA